MTARPMPDWMSVVPEPDRRVYEKAGMGKPLPWGRRPALLVIDVVQSFTGSAPQPVLSAIDEYDTACGDAAWQTLPRMREVLLAARAADMPIVFTKGDAEGKAQSGDSVKGDDPAAARRRHSTPIVDQLRPEAAEFVIAKTKASAFFATPLSTYLVRRAIDSLIMIGTSTSGCVRASVVDGHSHGYPVFVVADACFDRSDFFHKVSLFDMNAKYATVIDTIDLLCHLQAKPQAVV